jgi:hypothetical protein
MPSTLAAYGTLRFVSFRAHGRRGFRSDLLFVLFAQILQALPIEFKKPCEKTKIRGPHSDDRIKNLPSSSPHWGRRKRSGKRDNRADLRDSNLMRGKTNQLDVCSEASSSGSHLDFSSRGCAMRCALEMQKLCGDDVVLHRILY